MANWFISINGEQKGPYPTDQLRQLVADGFLSRDAYVWREGMATWQPLSQVRISDDAPAASPVPQVREQQQSTSYQAQQDAAQAQSEYESTSDYVKPGYFSFYGRISRKTYWLFYVLLPIILMSLASIPAGIVSRGFDWNAEQVNYTPLVAAVALSSIVVLVLAVAGIAGAVKRLHDRGRTGWFYFITLIPAIGSIWLLIELGFLGGTPGPNKYGPDPLG